MGPMRRLRVVGNRTASGTLDDVLAGAGRGDQAAFGEFYDLTAALVYGVVVRVVRDPAIAEEVAQEVYVELWRLAPRFDRRRDSAKAWTCTVAHRRAVDRVRSEQARRNREDRDGRGARRAFDEVSERVIEDLDRSRVDASLETLSAVQREAVTLAYYGGYTYREVAALLDVPEGTVKTRIRDALIKLRDELGVST